jgi:hypothetical protein
MFPSAGTGAIFPWPEWCDRPLYFVMALDQGGEGHDDEGGPWAGFQLRESRSIGVEKGYEYDIKLTKTKIVYGQITIMVTITFQKIADESNL